MLLNQNRIEAVVTGGNRCVGRKNYFAGNPRNGSVEIQAFLLHAAANRFEDGKPAVPFVQMQNAWRNAHRLEGAEAAHAQKQFLTDSKAAIPAIEPRSELPILGGVSFYVRIEQEQSAASYFQQIGRAHV